jgi:very-short-patch-repair endonuclease
MNNKSDMFYGASPEIFARAKNLRKRVTDAEKNLWNYLKDGAFNGYKFRRQHPIGMFIADFYAHKLKLVIELDGNHHTDNLDVKRYDKERETLMKEWGIQTIRYPNEIALYSPIEIVKDIRKHIQTFEHNLQQSPLTKT